MDGWTMPEAWLSGIQPATRPAYKHTNTTPAPAPCADGMDDGWMDAWMLDAAQDKADCLPVKPVRLSLT